jgi:hypothetical protein
MSATALAWISALGGIILQMLETREQIKQAALASGEITVEQLQEQDTLLLGQLQRLRDLVSPPQT